jgi:uncharacterized iron-regulated membrane protein
MRLRIVHRVLGLIAAPVMIVTATCGMLLLYRKTGLYELDGEFHQTVEHLHNYEIIAPYVGTPAALLMIAMACTGLALMLQVYVRRHRR